MGQKSYRSWLIVLALVGATVDQASKYGVFRWLNHASPRFNALQSTGEYDVVNGWFKLFVQYTDRDVPAGDRLQGYSAQKLPRVNHGALFGLGNHHEGLANSIFAGISVLAGLSIVGWSFRRSTARDRLLCMALGLILAGTIGNLYDRLVFGGVRDFLFFYRIDWPVFNVADCCLVCGAALLLVQAFLTRPATADAPAPASSAPAPEVAPAAQ